MLLYVVQSKELLPSKLTLTTVGAYFRGLRLGVTLYDC